MISTEVPRSRARSRSSASTWACTVTSRAVVGSSALSTCGLQETAMASSTRWRRRRGAADRLVPPEHLDDLAADPDGRVEGVHRLLEDHRGLAAAHVLEI